MKFITLAMIMVVISVVISSHGQPSDAAFAIQDTPTALIIVDMQGKYTDGKDAVPNIDGMIKNITELRNELKTTLGDKYLEIFTVDCLTNSLKCNQDDEDSKITTRLLEKTTGIPEASIHPSIPSWADPIKTEENVNERIKKDSKQIILYKAIETAEYSAFGLTKENQNAYGEKKNSFLHAILKTRGIKRVLVVGLAYQYCVLYTAADAAYLGYRSVIIENGTQSSAILKANFGLRRDNKSIEEEQNVEKIKTSLKIQNRLENLPKHLTVVTYYPDLRENDNIRKAQHQRRNSFKL